MVDLPPKYEKRIIRDDNYNLRLFGGSAIYILVYSLISLLLRMISYPRDFHYFAGNQQPAKIDYNLQYYNIMLLFHVLMRQQLFNEQSNVCCDLSNLK